ncbi:hypothetical protein HYY71_00760 [Candidatus Woesearchaeota archaeon]|nr:hypothetical protein [Candidatus Woesearchaeota archaeon]
MFKTKRLVDMKPFSSVVREINRTLNELILFENIVNTTLVFLVFYLVLSILDFPPLYALMPALLYLGFYSYMSFKSYKPLIVEGKYAPLREKLRTAADNVGMSNPIVEELEYEVTTEMKNVGLSMFINPRTLSYKIFAVMLLSFMIIFATTLNLKLLEFAKQKVPDIFDKPKGVGNFVATKLETSDDIYGKEDVAKLGDKELNIRIKPVDFKVNVKETGNVEQHKFDTTFPKDLAVKETLAYEENIPQEQQELVKNYFKKLAEG